MPYLHVALPQLQLGSQGFSVSLHGRLMPLRFRHFPVVVDDVTLMFKIPSSQLCVGVLIKKKAVTTCLMAAGRHVFILSR